MIELSRHIEILLLENDCVIVPAFGGFMAHHKPAEYMAEEGMFYPPQRTLGFNPQLKLNDSLLVQSYVEAYDISYPEAMRRIEAEVAEIKQTLNIEGQYEFHGIGTVMQKADERIEFEPCTAGLLTPTLYALNAFDFEMLQQVEKPVAVNIATTKVIETEAPAEEPTEIVDSEMTLETMEEDDALRIKISTLRNILVAAMMLALFVFASIPAGIGSSKVSMCSIIDTEVISSFLNSNASIIPAKAQMAFAQDTTKATTEIITDADIEEITDAAKTATEETTKEKKVDEKVVAEKVATEKANTNGRYTIILASMVSKTGAENLIQSLQKEGKDKGEISERNNMRKVIYGRFNTEEQAKEMLKELRDSNERFSDAWITKI